MIISLFDIAIYLYLWCALYVKEGPLPNSTFYTIVNQLHDVGLKIGQSMSLNTIKME
jgi:hypothetical protein